MKFVSETSFRLLISYQIKKPLSYYLKEASVFIVNSLLLSNGNEKNTPLILGSLYYSFIKHGVGYFKETSNISSFNVIDITITFSTILYANTMNRLHNC